MNGSSPLKHGLVDLAAIFFVVGGVVSLVMSLLSIPVSSIYPLTMPTNLTVPFLIVLVIGVIASFGAIHCASLTIRRLLSEAGIRGIVFGALLLIFGLGFASSMASTGGATGFNLEQGTATLLKVISAFLVLLGGIITFSMRHTSVSASPIAREHMIPQPMQR